MDICSSEYKAIEASIKTGSILSICNDGRLIAQPVVATKNVTTIPIKGASSIRCRAVGERPAEVQARIDVLFKENQDKSVVKLQKHCYQAIVDDYCSKPISLGETPTATSEISKPSSNKNLKRNYYFEWDNEKKELKAHLYEVSLWTRLGLRTSTKCFVPISTENGTTEGLLVKNQKQASELSLYLNQNTNNNVLLQDLSADFKDLKTPYKIVSKPIDSKQKLIDFFKAIEKTDRPVENHYFEWDTTTQQIIGHPYKPSKFNFRSSKPLVEHPLSLIDSSCSKKTILMRNKPDEVSLKLHLWDLLFDDLDQRADPLKTINDLTIPRLPLTQLYRLHNTIKLEIETAKTQIKNLINSSCITTRQSRLITSYFSKFDQLLKSCPPIVELNNLLKIYKPATEHSHYVWNSTTSILEYRDTLGTDNPKFVFISEDLGLVMHDQQNIDDFLTYLTSDARNIRQKLMYLKFYLIPPPTDRRSINLADSHRFYFPIGKEAYLNPKEGVLEEITSELSEILKSPTTTTIKTPDTSSITSDSGLIHSLSNSPSQSSINSLVDAQPKQMSYSWDREKKILVPHKYNPGLGRAIKDLLHNPSDKVFFCVDKRGVLLMNNLQDAIELRNHINSLATEDSIEHYISNLNLTSKGNFSSAFEELLLDSIKPSNSSTKQFFDNLPKPQTTDDNSLIYYSWKPDDLKNYKLTPLRYTPGMQAKLGIKSKKMFVKYGEVSDKTHYGLLFEDKAQAEAFTSYIHDNDILSHPQKEDLLSLFAPFKNPDKRFEISPQFFSKNVEKQADVLRKISDKTEELSLKYAELERLYKTHPYKTLEDIEFYDGIIDDGGRTADELKTLVDNARNLPFWAFEDNMHDLSAIDTLVLWSDIVWEITQKIDKTRCALELVQ